MAEQLSKRLNEWNNFSIEKKIIILENNEANKKKGILLV